MNYLDNWLHKLIREKGPLSFRDFMYWALYHPDWGYYNRDAAPFGKQGDFYTSPGVHAVFGETIAGDLIGKWHELGEPDPFILVEFGAGQGLLALDILTSLAAREPALNVNYHIIEISPRLRAIQSVTLTDKHITWLTDIKELGVFTGIVLSNELLDAFPVHLLSVGQDGLRESFVGLQHDQLVEQYQVVTTKPILDFITRYLPAAVTEQAEPVTKQWQQKFEVNLDAMKWLRHVSQHLDHGFVITIDYGEESGDLYQGRPQGSLRGFRQHQVTDQFYSSVGEFDITADINFTSLMLYGEQLGLQTVYYGTQGKYLLQAGILQLMNQQPSLDPFHPSMRRNLAVKQLIMPGSMGERFKVLIQRKTQA